MVGPSFPFFSVTLCENKLIVVCSIKKLRYVIYQKLKLVKVRIDKVLWRYRMLWLNVTRKTKRITNIHCAINVQI